MATNDIHRVVIEGTLHAQTVQTVLHYLTTVDTGLSPVAQATALAARVAAIVVPQLKSIQSAEYAHTRIIVQKIFPLPPRLPIINTTALGAGSVAGSSLPCADCAVITKRTIFAGRKYRGRIFVPGVPVTSELDSQLSPAALTTWQAVADAINVALVQAPGDTWAMTLWHKSTSTNDVVTQLIARPILRSQRRRQVGRGK